MINNRKELTTMYSDCVYPDWTNRDKYIFIGRLDEEYVKEELERCFECDGIANKYAIQMPNGIIWYKHDFNVFALQEISPD